MAATSGEQRDLTLIPGMAQLAPDAAPATAVPPASAAAAGTATAAGSVTAAGSAAAQPRVVVPLQPVRDAAVATGPAVLRPAAPPLVERWLLRWGVRPFLMLLDAGACAVASSLTTWRPLDALTLVAALFLLDWGRMYESRLTMSVLEDASHLVGRILGAGALVVAVCALAQRSRLQDPLLLTCAVFVGFALLFRAVGYAIVRDFRRRRIVAHPTLLLGAGKVGGQIATLLMDHPEYGLDPVGFLDRNPLLAADQRPVPLLGGDDVLAQTIVEFGVRDVVVAFGSLPESGLVEVIRTCDRLDCEIFFVPRLFELYTISRDVDQVWGLPLVRLRRAAYRTQAWRVKRVFDVLASAAALLLLAPVMAAVALAVRVEGGPGILFRQTRVGLDGRPFDVLKFRSLRPVDDTESATQWNIQHDDRLGPVGRFIRASSLDELPQLLNILRGDMSLVGPRPERPHFVSTFANAYPRYVARHRVPAGLTGWAQVHGLRGDTSIEERARFDNYYIENWSIWLDLRILLRTVSQVIRRAGG